MPKEAEAESRLVLQARQQVLGAEHPSTLATRHDVARYLAEQDKVFEAEAIFRQVLTSRSRGLSLDHPRTLESRYELAVALARQGRADDARAMLDQVLEAQAKFSGRPIPARCRQRRRSSASSPNDERTAPSFSAEGLTLPCRNERVAPTHDDAG